MAASVADAGTSSSTVRRLTASEILTAPARQAAGLKQTDHRQWPLPAGRWLMGQTWEDLLFAHWRVAPAALRPHVPEGVRLDTFDGSAWLGMTPFRITGLRVRGALPLPGLSSLLELNVRTYVTRDAKPGIWFFSLDASSSLAVAAARRAYHLPYFQARIEAVERGERVEFESSRLDGAAEPRVFSARYRPSGAVFEAEGGSLEEFLTERYCLYALAEGKLRRAEIHHPPWPLQEADAEVELNTMAPEGVELGDEAPLCHLSRRQDVVIWPLRPV